MFDKEQNTMRRKLFSLMTVIVLVFGLLPVAPAVRPAYAASITVNTTDDELNNDGDCSLREAIQAANTNTAVSGCTAGSGDDTITVPAGTYTLTIPGNNEDNGQTGDLDITSNITIIGAG
ncbi:MAG: CSLREA domain-containing protein, partial [Anaerolineales bacterium]|nr:CSLREA domain-containing protein [Anaerolineales bacterium]